MSSGKLEPLDEREVLYQCEEDDRMSRLASNDALEELDRGNLESTSDSLL
jgi:hypothetical protein